MHTKIENNKLEEKNKFVIVKKEKLLFLLFLISNFMIFPDVIFVWLLLSSE